MAALRETLDKSVLMLDGSAFFPGLLLGSCSEGVMSAAVLSRN